MENTEDIKASIIHSINEWINCNQSNVNECEKHISCQSCFMFTSKHTRQQCYYNMILKFPRMSQSSKHDFANKEKMREFIEYINATHIMQIVDLHCMEIQLIDTSITLHIRN